MPKHWIALLAALSLVFLAVAPAEGGRARPNACGAQEYSYAGLQSEGKAHGIAATLTALTTPNVQDGHVAGWIGVGGVDAGPGGTADWLQVGYASFSPDPTIKLYYELTVPGKDTRYVELDSKVVPGEKHQVAVLEMANRNAWWRVWLDGKPATAPRPTSRPVTKSPAGRVGGVRTGAGVANFSLERGPSPAAFTAVIL